MMSSTHINFLIFIDRQKKKKHYLKFSLITQSVWAPYYNILVSKTGKVLSYSISTSPSLS